MIDPELELREMPLPHPSAELDRRIARLHSARLMQQAHAVRRHMSMLAAIAASLLIGFAIGRVTTPRQTGSVVSPQRPSSAQRLQGEPVHPTDDAPSSLGAVQEGVAIAPLDEPPRLSHELLQAMTAQARPLVSPFRKSPPPFVLPADPTNVIDLREHEYH